MKRVIAIGMLVVMLILSFCSCGNMSMGMGTYTFNHIRFNSGMEGHCAEVDKWYDYETGIEVKTEDGVRYWLSEGTYILISDQKDCPFCNN